MNIKKSDSLKLKLTYLRFIYKITEHIKNGKRPPVEMIKQTQDLGRRVNSRRRIEKSRDCQFL